MMEKELWKEFSERMMELEQDREKVMGLKKKLDRSKEANEYLYGPLVIFMAVLILTGTISGFIAAGIIGAVISFISFFFWVGLLGGYGEWRGKRAYRKELPAYQNSLEEAKRNQEKYAGCVLEEQNILISSKIFSAEAVCFLADIISRQEEADLESAVDQYRNSDKYRPNLIAVKSEKNKEFLDMLAEKGE